MLPKCPGLNKDLSCDQGVCVHKGDYNAIRFDFLDKGGDVGRQTRSLCGCVEVAEWGLE
jgi:hypothetical protein